MLALAFSVGPDRYAVDVRRVARVVPRIGLRPVPHADGALAGLLDYAGAAVPVMDLGKLLGGEPSASRLSTRIMLLRADPARPADLLGLIAEQVTDLRDVPDDDGSELPFATRAGRALGPIVRLDRGMVQLLRVEHLVPLLRAGTPRDDG